MKRIKNKRVREVVQEAGKISGTDILGSYTGNPAETTQTPTQDADDL
ncbi:MAG TPA: hypothetical protein P5161_02025 [Eubacteriales bacterium]|mgnify:FL=1|jgi:hypothetical protein|nr:hypothetical protein [Clostridia bacterium]HRR89543.1 hypothetical protein [Eubacteriales bacterium]HRU84548.1 hypothetical protein [Eubacteriales bacterium]